MSKEFTEVTIVPVTKAEMTQTDINHSLKIGKQVIKKRLEKEIDALSKKSTEISKKRADVLKNSGIYTYLKESATTLSKKDPKIKSLLSLLNTFGSEPLKRKDIVSDYADLEVIRNYLEQNYYVSHEEHAKFTEEALQTGMIQVSVPFRLEANTDDETVSFSAVYDVPLLPAHIESIEARRDLLSSFAEVVTKQVELQKKLDGIDATMEEIEAEILVKELSSSDHGKQLLAITSDIVSKVLGDTPDLLKKVDK